MLNPAKLERLPVSSDMFTTQEAIAMFGKPNVDPKLCEVNKRLKRIEVPYKLKLYERSAPATLSRISVHELIADYVAAALHRIHEIYGDKEIERLGLNVYSGCYNARPIRGGKDWSKHAFAIALDWLAQENGLHTPFAKSTFGRPEYKEFLDSWQMSGFLNLGRLASYGRDAMHMEWMQPVKWKV